MKRGILVFYELVVVGAIVWTMSQSASEGQIESLPELAQCAGVRFPPGTRLVGAWHERGLDDLLMFKVELPESSVPAFLSLLPVVERIPKGAIFATDHGFWDPSSASFERYFEGRVADRSLQIGIAAPKNGWVTVYVETFTT